MAKFRWHRMEAERRAREHGASPGRPDAQTLAELRRLRRAERKPAKAAPPPPTRPSDADFDDRLRQESEALAGRLFGPAGTARLRRRPRPHFAFASPAEDGTVAQPDREGRSPPRRILVERRHVPPPKR